MSEAKRAPACPIRVSGEPVYGALREWRSFMSCKVSTAHFHVMLFLSETHFWKALFHKGSWSVFLSAAEEQSVPWTVGVLRVFACKSTQICVHPCHAFRFGDLIQASRFLSITKRFCTWESVSLFFSLQFWNVIPDSKSMLFSAGFLIPEILSWRSCWKTNNWHQLTGSWLAKWYFKREV
jgi:hypothetical protein